jgi:L-glutamine:2-deoxy-scyllo-inosose/3-amino-2,3-dideoxy-scyllo-inosose aminotransferase
MTALAIAGGSRLLAADWPPWPATSPSTERKVVESIRSHRWALSGPRTTEVSREQTFAAEFADFIGVRHCVPTTNGTASLVTALEALDIGAGDEVIIPGLTWVASASTVMAVNARPVIVDIDPSTLCIDPRAILAAIGPRTAAVSIVHLYNSLCDLDAIVDLCRSHGLALIEDCAQAHGARWRNRRVGGWGDIGTFSMQQTKLLTAGEGGAAVTDDQSLFRRLYQLRSDGRTQVPTPRRGEMELALTGDVMGSNFCMSEIIAAVLSAQLEELDQQNNIRSANATRLDMLLAEIPGVTPVPALPQVTERTHYYYVFHISPESFGGADASVVAEALRAETGAPFQSTYLPLPRHPLIRPQSKRRFQSIERIDELTSAHVPAAEDAYRAAVTLHHSALLADPRLMGVIAEAIGKVQHHAGELARTSDLLVNPL